MTTPDPLAQMQRDLATPRRGRLKVFLGMAAGVGKTFAMLSEAHSLAARGDEVVVGYVEPHGREETESLVQGLECLPVREIEHKGVILRDFDLDAALVRAPQILLVDELAHTNPDGARHAKRWQDVEECLRAGIDVLTTVNIQHIESLRDVVAQVTYVFVQETVPDSFFERADEIELVDIPPEELHQRLRDGKVYRPEKIDQALSGFFKRSNLLALRELALRHTAQQVDRAIRSERVQGIDPEPWHVTERILVCLAPSRMAPRVLRAARRLAASLHAEMIVTTVDNPRQGRLNTDGQAQLEYALGLASSLGARTATLHHSDIVGELIRFARSENVTTIVMGKPVRARWKELVFGSVVDATVRASGEIDVLVITGAEEAGTHLIRRPKPAPMRWSGIAEAFAFPAIFTAIGAAFYSPVQITNIAMLYVVASVLVSLRQGLRESALAAVISAASFNFFFIEPRFTFAVTDFRYTLTFAVLVAVSVLLSSLTLRLRENSEALAERERRTSRLYEITKRLAESGQPEEMAELIVDHLRTTLGGDAAVYVALEGSLTLLQPSQNGFETGERERAVAEWVLSQREPAGAGTETLGAASGLYLPLIGSQLVVGVLVVERTQAHLTSAQRHYLDAVAAQLAGALERTQFAEQAQERAVRAESEVMRSNLLSTVSHDLRTPLASIEGSADALLTRDNLQGTDRELAANIRDESRRMARLIQNLLDMTRVQGKVQLRLEWENLEELVRNAVDRTASLLNQPVRIVRPAHAVLAKMDGVLMEQVLVNLLENAARHAGADAEVEVVFGLKEDRAWVTVRDDGPGIPEERRSGVFEAFERSGKEGFGLGLAICKAAVEAHGGTINIESVAEGTCIRIEVPVPA